MSRSVAPSQRPHGSNGATHLGSDRLLVPIRAPAPSAARETLDSQDAVSRRTKTGQRRDHRVGPLRFNDDELRVVTNAANRVGLSVGAYVTDAALRLARAETESIPLRRGDMAVEPQDIRDALTSLRVVADRPQGDSFDRLLRTLVELVDVLQSLWHGAA